MSAPPKNVQNLARAVLNISPNSRNTIINSMCKYEHLGSTGTQLPKIHGCYNIKSSKASFGKSHTISHVNRYSYNTMKANLEKIRVFKKYLEKLEDILIEISLNKYKEMITGVTNKNRLKKLQNKYKFNQQSIINNAYTVASKLINNDTIVGLYNKLRIKFPNAYKRLQTKNSFAPGTPTRNRNKPSSF